MLPTQISAFISTSSLWPKSDSCPLQCRKPESCLLSQHLPQKHGTAHSTAVSYGQQITGLPVSCSPPFSRFLSYTHSIRQGLHFRITVQHLDIANSISAPDRDSKHTEIQVITSVHGSLTKTSTQAPKREGLIERGQQWTCTYAFLLLSLQSLPPALNQMPHPTLTVSPILKYFHSSQPLVMAQGNVRRQPDQSMPQTGERASCIHGMKPASVE